MSSDDGSNEAGAHDLSWAEAVEQARPRIEEMQATITGALDQILAAAAEVARWWQGAREPYMAAYGHLDERTRGIVDALEALVQARQQEDGPGMEADEEVGDDE